MLIDVLICRADGSQELVRRETPDNYRDIEAPEDPASVLEARLSRLERIGDTLTGRLSSLEGLSLRG